MSKREFKSLRSEAIQWCIAWRDYSLTMMEAALEQDHTIAANEHFLAANRAEQTADILKTASRAQFDKWIAQYESTGIATLGAL